MQQTKEKRRKSEPLPCVAKTHITEVWGLFQKMKDQGKIQSFRLETVTCILDIRKRFLVSICKRQIVYTFSPARKTMPCNHFESANARFVEISLFGSEPLGSFLEQVEADVLIKWSGFTLEDNVEEAFSEKYRPGWCMRFERASDKLAVQQGINFVIKVMHSEFGIYDTYDINVKKISTNKEMEKIQREKYTEIFPHTLIVPLELTAVPKQIHEGVLNTIKMNKSKKSRIHL